MEIDFDQIIPRHGTASMKWDKYNGQDVLPMWVADMDFKVPQPVLDALAGRIEHGVFGYTLVPEELNQAVVRWMRQRHGWEIQPDWIVWLPGVVSALNLCCRVFTKPGRKIVTTTPIYPPFLSAHQNAGKEALNVPMTLQSDRWCLDFDALDRAFQQDAALFLFCSPYNPGGTVFDRDELQQLVDLCERHDVIICSDEIHHDLVIEPGICHTPTAAVSAAASNRTVTLAAPSKTFNIPGLGCSFAVIENEALRKKFKSATRGAIPEVGTMGSIGALAAYTEGAAWLDSLIVYLKTNRDQVLNRVRQMPGCRVSDIHATYLAWIDMRETGIENPAGFLEKNGVGLSDGAYFGAPGFVRLNFGCPAALLDKGLDRMSTALNSVPQSRRRHL